MGIGPSAGSKIFIGTSESIASPDDFIEIGDIANAGEFGRRYQEIVAQSLGTRGDRKYKGTYNDGTMQVQLNRDPSDLGQAAAITARDSDSDFNFKVVLNDAAPSGLTNNTTFYFKAKVMSYTVNIGGPNNVVGATMDISIKSGSITEVTAS